ncbi:class I SAM-dependent methyltransferase [Marinagarivorans algicola]|uniref:class I SAM-dependent methyltransferase n=1 Tax=Marinagarivorans algicola TaxID=1513270 RepID=UPI0006B6602F|nr:methyltransferase [Marinagarivorans algicola]
MQDIAISQLLQQLQMTPAEANTLWFADENSYSALGALTPYMHNLTVLTNRFDIYQQAQTLGLKSVFNDVDFTAACPVATDAVFMRISKEKAVTHHAINQAVNTLSLHGQLHLAGYKNEGIKTYAQKAATLFNHSSKLKKQKDSHICSLSHPKAAAHTELLDSSHYTQLRTIGEYAGKQLVSKPGVFGYEKIDDGSQLLLESAQVFLSQHACIHTQARTLDLGCGYGLLAMTAHQWGLQHITATDNNAAALSAIRAGAAQNNININVIAADAGKGITDTFDIILCNPPFHQGFEVSGDLTDKFLRNASQLLAKNGCALFVVNSFIAIEKKALSIFKYQKTLCNNKQFKVVLLANNELLTPNANTQ